MMLAWPGSEQSRDLPRQESGSHFDSQTPDYWQNDTQLYFVKFSVVVVVVVVVRDP